MNAIRTNTEEQRMDIQNNSDDAHLKLPVVLDLAAAEGFLDTMRGRLLAGSQLAIDASAVETLTLPCIQIILAALRSDAQVAIVRPSPAFVSAFRDLGLACEDAIVPDQAASRPDHAPESAAPTLQPDADAGGGCGPDENQAAALASPFDAPMEEPAMTKRILTIDDSKTIRDMLRLTLLDAGFEVLQAVDGQDGVDVLEREKVDVVITDINMPKMDGYGVIRHMRAQPAHKSTPILVLTTESEVEKRNIAREAGATGWMVKPFDPEQLVATIYKVAP